MPARASLNRTSGFQHVIKLDFLATDRHIRDANRAFAEEVAGYADHIAGYVGHFAGPIAGYAGQFAEEVAVHAEQYCIVVQFGFRILNSVQLHLRAAEREGARVRDIRFARFAT